MQDNQPIEVIDVCALDDGRIQIRVASASVTETHSASIALPREWARLLLDQLEDIVGRAR